MFGGSRNEARNGVRLTDWQPPGTSTSITCYPFIYTSWHNVSIRPLATNNNMSSPFATSLPISARQRRLSLTLIVTGVTQRHHAIALPQSTGKREHSPAVTDMHMRSRSQCKLRVTSHCRRCVPRDTTAEDGGAKSHVASYEYRVMTATSILTGGVGCMHVDMWFSSCLFFGGSGGTVSDEVVHGNTLTDRMQGRVAQHP
jgi:hypothetical protein